jgi:hypothetical protein
MILVKGTSQVEDENYANTEAQNVANWARKNKMSFNYQKSKVMIITKKKPKNRRDINTFLNKNKTTTGRNGKLLRHHHLQEN